MTNYQLLIPRFKNIQDFWNNPFKTDEIITMNFKPTALNNTSLIQDWYHSCQYPDSMSGWSVIEVKKFRDFPKLFQELKWHENRKPGDMPPYIKNDKGVYKVYKHFTYILRGIENKVKDVFSLETKKSDQEYDYLRYDECVPATEEEYNQHSDRNIKKEK